MLVMEDGVDSVHVILVENFNHPYVHFTLEFSLNVVTEFTEFSDKHDII